MCGRAGRAGLDDYGEAVVITSVEKKQRTFALINASQNCTHFVSCFIKSERFCLYIYIYVCVCVVSHIVSNSSVLAMMEFFGNFFMQLMN